VISEIMYHPSDPDEDEVAAGYEDDNVFEFLELLNIGEGAVSLAGLQFSKGLAFDFSQSSVSRLQPGERVLLVRKRDAFEHRYGPELSARIIGEFANDTGLDNSGERLALIAVDGSIVRDFEYNDRAPWPLPPDGGGHSLVLSNPSFNPDHGVPANWQSSAAPGGTPASMDTFNFVTWAVQFGDPAFDSDHDQDSHVALLEFAEGGDPTIAESSSDAIRVQADPLDGSVRVAFRRNLRAAGLRIELESSDDLLNWRSADDDWIFLGEEFLGEGRAMVSFRSAPGKKARFIRQRVSLP
jgi:hypothetical protein